MDGMYAEKAGAVFSRDDSEIKLPRQWYSVTASAARHSETVQRILVIKTMDTKTYYVYILTNQSNRVLYTGVTNNLERRLYEHKNKLIDGFTSKYNCNKLVWYEVTESVESAITREKQIKAGSRGKKMKLIESINPQWRDLSLDWG